MSVIFAGVYFYYQSSFDKNDKSANYIPNKAAFVLKVPLKHFGFTSLFSDASYWNQLTNIPSLNRVSSQLLEFESVLLENRTIKKLISNSNIYVSAFATKSDDFDLLYVVKVNKEHNPDTLQNTISKLLGDAGGADKRNFNGETITEYKLEGQREFSYTVLDNYFIGSFTSFLVDDAIAQSQEGVSLGLQGELNKGINISNKVELMCIYKNAPSFLKIFSDKRAGESGIDVLEFYSELSNFKLTIDSNSISGNSNRELYSQVSFVKHYEGQTSSKIDLFSLLPSSTSAVKHISISNISNWIEELKHDRSKMISGYSIDEYLQGLNNKYNTDLVASLTSWCSGNYAQVILDPPNSNYKDFVFAFFEADEMGKAKEELSVLAKTTSIKENIVSEIYNDAEIVSIDVKGVLPLIYGNVFNKVQTLTYTSFNNYIIFGNTSESLKLLLDELNSKELLIDGFSQDELAFIENKQCNYLLYSNPANSEYIIDAHFNEKWFANYNESKEELSAISSFFYSYDYNDARPNSSFLISFNKKRASSVKLAWKKEFENNLSTRPFLLKNATSKVYKILIQDEENNLYCIDEEGEILWQKKIAAKILNHIEAVDMRANGQTQYLFNTKRNVYLIDDKGANVLNYPIQLPYESSMPIVFLNNKNTKDLTYYVYCKNKQIYAYNMNGRPMVNWKHRGEEIELARNMQTVSTNLETQLVMSYSNGIVEFCKPNGEVVTEYIYNEGMSPNNTFYREELGEGFWVSTDKIGNVVMLSAKGDVDIIPNPTMSAEHSFYYSDIDNDLNKDLIYLDEGELNAYDQDLIMVMYKRLSKDLAPFISVNELTPYEMSIGVVSNAANEIHLFNSDGLN
ncbi:MAG: hypothetical protein HKO56_08970, partial [Bacteroidia bacterium]|nr:hypothetical protein [Bacteroidia bacterium]